MISQLMYSILNIAASKGLAEAHLEASATQRARKTGVRGETYAYWYLRHHGYVVIARNFTVPGMKGELDIVGYDGPMLAFVEVKTRTATELGQSRPEDAINHEKRRNLTRMARQFLRARHLDNSEWRFDVLAIETRLGQKPTVRLHKAAFGEDNA
ncbi:MAG: YraN family protein [Candidatus Acidiferrales bacterium]